MRQNTNKRRGGFTLVEIVVAASLLAVATIVMSQAMLVLNKNSAIARVRNLAKAAVLSRVQEAGAVKFDPAADTPVVPTPLVVGTTTDNILLGDATAGIGTLPATLKWTVTSDTNNIRTINCRVDYTYLGRSRNYEVVTYRSPD